MYGSNNMKKSVVFNNQFNLKFGGQFELENGGQFAPELVVNLHWKVVVNLTGFSNSSTILSCKSALERLAKTENHAYTILQKNLDMLGNIKEIYIQANIIQKREFVKLVFDNNLYYQDGIYRTPTLIDSLSHNHLIMKEKGLLVCNKKRDDFSIIPSSGIAGNRTRVQTSN